jgi:hypothetical protein
VIERSKISNSLDGDSQPSAQPRLDTFSTEEEGAHGISMPYTIDGCRCGRGTDMTTPSESQAGRRLYGVNLKHGTWYNRVWLDGPSGPSGEAKFDEIRTAALQLAEETSDIVEFKGRVLALFLANDFHQCDT